MILSSDKDLYNGPVLSFEVSRGARLHTDAPSPPPARLTAARPLPQRIDTIL